MVIYRCNSCNKKESRSIAGWEIECHCGGVLTSEPMTFIEKLKHHRKHHRLSQRQLADELGVSRSYYGFMELGTREIPPRIIAKITKMLQA